MNAAFIGAALALFLFSLLAAMLVIFVLRFPMKASPIPYVCGAVAAAGVAFIPIGGPDAAGLLGAALAIAVVWWRYATAKHRRAAST